jgi:hypothetical protein
MTRSNAQGENTAMATLLLLLLGIAGFAGLIAYVTLCERL